jgi:hypothetical protein
MAAKAKCTPLNSIIWEELGLCINQKAIFTKKEKFLSICRRIAYTVISWLSK